MRDILADRHRVKLNSLIGNKKFQYRVFHSVFYWEFDNSDLILKSLTFFILVRERVLGPRHPEVSFYIRYRGAVYAGNLTFTKFEKILSHL